MQKFKNDKNHQVPQRDTTCFKYTKSTRLGGKFQTTPIFSLRMRRIFLTTFLSWNNGEFSFLCLSLFIFIFLGFYKVC